MEGLPDHQGRFPVAARPPVTGDQGQGPDRDPDRRRDQQGDHDPAQGDRGQGGRTEPADEEHIDQVEGALEEAGGDQRDPQPGDRPEDAALGQVAGRRHNPSAQSRGTETLSSRPSLEKCPTQRPAAVSPASLRRSISGRSSRPTRK